MSDDFAGLNWTADDRALWSAGVQPVFCTQNDHGVWSPQKGTTGGAPAFAAYPRPVGVPVRPALRPPLGATLFDVDSGRDGKVGDATLAAMESRLGALPSTWSLTARGSNQSSGRFLFRHPEDLVITDAPFTAFGGSVEVVRFGHRFSWAPGDIHPGTGTPVVCFAPNGQPCALPPVSHWPMLPDAWVFYFRSFTRAGATFSGPAGEPRQVAIGAAQGAADNAWGAVLTDRPGSGTLRSNIGKWTKAEGSLIVAQGVGVGEAFERLCQKLTAHSLWGTADWDPDVTWATMIDYMRRYVLTEPIVLTEAAEMWGSLPPVSVAQPAGVPGGLIGAPVGTFTDATRPTVSGGAYEWSPEEPPVPLDIDATAMPPLWLPPVIDDLLRSMVVAFGIPAEFALGPMLGALSAGAQTMGVRYPNGHVEPLCVWCVALSESGTRKSSTLNRAAGWPLAAAQRALADEFAPDGSASALAEKVAALDARVKTCRNEVAKATAPMIAQPGGPDIPDWNTPQQRELDRAVLARDAAQAELDKISSKRGKPDILTTDASTEALVEHMQESNGPATFISAEGTTLRTLAGRYDSSGADSAELSDLNNAYDGSFISSRRVGKGHRKVERPSLAMALFSQTKVSLELLRKIAEAGSGFTARMLLIVPEMGYQVNDVGTVDEAAQARWTARIVEVVRRGWKASTEAPDVLTLDPDAAAVLSEFGTRLRKQARELNSGHELIKEWTSKAQGKAARIAALLSLAWDPAATTVPLWAAQVAAMFMTWQASEAYRLLYGSDDGTQTGDADLKRCATVFGQLLIGQRKPSRKFTLPDVRNQVKAWRDQPALVESLIHGLVQRGWVIAIYNDKGRLTGYTPRSDIAKWIDTM